MSRGIYSELGKDPFFNICKTSQPSSTAQAIQSGFRTGIASNPALGLFVQSRFEIMQFKMPNMLSNDRDEASISTTTVKTNTSE